MTDMRIAVISDIHANIHALRAVLDDVRTRDVDEIWCAGDLVGYLPFPNEVIEVIRDAGIPTVMGNYDDGVAFDRIQCGCDYPDERAMELGLRSLAWTKEHVTRENKIFLAGLPREMRREVAGARVLLVHGSPRRLNEYLVREFPEEELREILREASAGVLICGHTHIPYRREVGGELVINAGSVGKPKHGNPNATYALVDFDEDGKTRTEFIEVPYDCEAAARAIVDAGLPEEFAELIREGRG